MAFLCSGYQCKRQKPIDPFEVLFFFNNHKNEKAPLPFNRWVWLRQVPHAQRVELQVTSERVRVGRQGVVTECVYENHAGDVVLSQCMKLKVW